MNDHKCERYDDSRAKRNNKACYLQDRWHRTATTTTKQNGRVDEFMIHT